MSRRTSRRIAIAVLGALALAFAARVDAQFRRGGFNRGFFNVRKATPEDFDGQFHFCRVAFGTDRRGDGGDWSVDWPRADINLSIRLSELTKTTVPMDAEGDPAHLLVQLTDPELFDCPFIMMTEVGSASINPIEAQHLRDYLLKGGFLWADDFWGDYAWEWWVEQFRQVLPAEKYPIVDLPPDHPLYHTQFNLKETPQISNIATWINTGTTSERGAESAQVHTRAVLDADGRIMVLMTHNTDFGDSFEREGDDPAYFNKMSVPGYQFGINALLYAFTH